MKIRMLDFESRDTQDTRVMPARWLKVDPELSWAPSFQRAPKSLLPLPQSSLGSTAAPHSLCELFFFLYFLAL